MDEFSVDVRDGRLLENLVVLIEFVGGPADGALVWRRRNCDGCGRAIMLHQLEALGCMHALERVEAVPGKLIARPVQELPA